MPKRVQIQSWRKRGGKKPDNTVVVARPGRHGNPFRVGDYAMIGDGTGGKGFFKMSYTVTTKEYADDRYTFVADNETAVRLFREWRERYPLPTAYVVQLHGKDLACYCKPDEPCHADVLLELVNG